MIQLKELLWNPGEVIKNSDPGFREGLKISVLSGLGVGLLLCLQSFLVLGSHVISLHLIGLGVVLGLIGPAMSAVSVHPLVYYFGGKRYEETYKLFAFHTPYSIPGSVAVLNILAIPALFILQLRALKQVHGLEWREAVAAVLVPGIGLTVVGLAVFEFLVRIGFISYSMIPIA